MSKKIVTEPGRGYVATMSAGGEISAVGDSGAKLTLASGGAGEQVSFQAIGLEVECSDDGAVILPFSGASLSIGGGSGAGAGGDAVADAVDDALCNKVDDTVSGDAGEDNATVHLVVLAAARVPNGYIKKIGLKNRSNYLGSKALYLAVYERDGSGEAWEKRGVSKNTVTQTAVGASKVSEWEFEGLRVHGREMSMLWSESAQMVPEPDAAAEGELTFGVKVKNDVDDGSKCDKLNAVPEYSFEVQRLEPKFVAEEQLREHAEDGELHLKAGERAKWDGAATGLTAHTGDAVKHVTAEERAKWDGAATGLAEHVGDKAKHLGAVEGETGVAYMANEGNGGIMKFTKADGSVGKVTLFDGTDEDRTYVQVTAHTGDKAEIVRMNVSPDGIYYTKGAGGGKAAEHEVATVGDVAAAGLTEEQKGLLTWLAENKAGLEALLSPQV